MKKDAATEGIQQELLRSGNGGLVREFFLFFRKSKSYWIIPIIVFTLLLIGLASLTLITGGAAAPFIYTLF